MMLKTRQSKPNVALILIGLIVPCFLISIPAVIAYRAERLLASSFSWVNHTHEVQRCLQKLLLLLINAETRQRGFLLTTNDSFITAFESELPEFPQEFNELKTLTADNSIQQEGLKQLEPLVMARLEAIAQTISARKHAATSPPTGVLIADGNNEMDVIRSLVDTMDQEEQRLLGARQKVLAASAHWNTIVLSALVILNVVFSGAIVLLFRRLSKLQRLITVCAWSRTVEYDGEWISFEEYLLRRYGLKISHGISPAEADRFCAS